MTCLHTTYNYCSVLWSHDCNSGPWQPSSIYEGCSILWSYNHHFQPFLLTSKVNSHVMFYLRTPIGTAVISWHIHVLLHLAMELVIKVIKQGLHIFLRKPCKYNTTLLTISLLYHPLNIFFPFATEAPQITRFVDQTEK